MMNAIPHQRLEIASHGNGGGAGTFPTKILDINILNSCAKMMSSPVPLSILPCVSPATPQPKRRCLVARKRRIHFNNTVSIREVKHRKDMDRQEFEDVWYSKQDFLAIRRRMHATVIQMQMNFAGGTDVVDETDNDFCERGLGASHQNLAKCCRCR